MAGRLGLKSRFDAYENLGISRGYMFAMLKATKVDV